MDANKMTLDEIKKHLRKDYKWYECPKKYDRLMLPEDIWIQINWTQAEKTRNIALPHKLWNMLHDDLLWPRCRSWRGDDAYGYRAGEGHPKYMPELPKLVEGRGIARWMAKGDSSVAEVLQFADYRTLWTEDNMPEIIEFFERKYGHPDFGKQLRLAKKNFLKMYSPSSLQKFSKRSYLLREPYHYSKHIMVQKNELYEGKYKPDWVFFYRRGWRWDSYDGYMVKNGFYVGLRWN